MNSQQHEDDDSRMVEGYWYIPVECENFERLEIEEFRKLKRCKFGEIDGQRTLYIPVLNENGRFDDYLAGMILELFYVNTVSRVHTECKTESYDVREIIDKRMKRIREIAGGHTDVVVLKTLYYKGISYLKMLLSEPFRDFQADKISEKHEIGCGLMEFYKDFCFNYIEEHHLYSDIDSLPKIPLSISEQKYYEYLDRFYFGGEISYEEFLKCIGGREKRYTSHEIPECSRWLGLILHRITMKNPFIKPEYQFDEYDYDNHIYRNLKSILGNYRHSDIYILINIWTSIFCVGLGEFDCKLDPGDVFTDTIILENIYALERKFAEIEISYIRGYSATVNLNKKDPEIDYYVETLKLSETYWSSRRIRTFKKMLSMNRILYKQYFCTMSKRCYGQMWIDNSNTQYFALSCGPNTERKTQYYSIAKLLLNSCQDHVKYEEACFDNEMRYYFGNSSHQYVTYASVLNNEKFMEYRKDEGYKGRDPINRMFSCCERKLLVVVEKLFLKRKLCGREVHMCVKYKPCQICNRALNAYSDKGVKIDNISSNEKLAGKNSSDKFIQRIDRVLRS